MAKLSVKEIQTLAKKIVAENPGGIRYSALVQRISLENPETPKNTIHGSVWDLATRFPREITKPSRGLFLPATSAVGGVTVSPPVLPPGRIRDEDFYEPFADWLKNELDQSVKLVAAAPPRPLQARHTAVTFRALFRPLILSGWRFFCLPMAAGNSGRPRVAALR